MTEIIMKKFIFVLIFGLMFFSFAGVVSAADYPAPKDKYVNDFANVLNAKQANELRNLFISVDSETSAEMVFVSLPTINDEDIGNYAFALANKWKVGKADKDNGFLILYVLNTNRIFAATGYGVEGILPDSKVGRLLDENYVFLRDSGNVSEGIVKFSDAVSQVMLENKEEILSGMASPDYNRRFDILGIIFWIIIIYFIVKSFSGKGKRIWFLPLFLPGRRSNFSSGFSSGFGGGFGGGSFGGGGAGR